MRVSSIVFYLASVTVAFLVINILLYSIRENNVARQELRVRGLDHSVVPSGDKELHDEMVQFVSENEPRYLHCLKLERENREYASTECHFSSGHTEMLRRLHALRNDQEIPLRYIQIGSINETENDPIYRAIIEPHILSKPNYWPPLPVQDIHAVLVEPLRINALHMQYEAYFQKIPDLKRNYFQFIASAVNQDESVTANNGKCSFYVPSPRCQKQKEFSKQVSGIDPSFLKKVFKGNSRECIKQIQVKCITLSDIFSKVGFNISKQTVKQGTQKSVSCKTNHDKDVLDALVVDAEGFSGQIIHMMVDELCPSLWPSIIIYADKLLRLADKSSGQESPGDSNFDMEYDTEDADEVIELLEQNGYYSFLFEENVVALRIGYAIDEMRHSLFDPPDLSIFRQKAWLHPRSSRTLVT